jgi:integrase
LYITNNLYLTVLEMLEPVNYIPRDQVRAALRQLGSAEEEKALFVEWGVEEADEDESAQTSISEAREAKTLVYGRVLAEIDSLLEPLLEEVKDKNSLNALRVWSEKHKADLDNPPARNTAWMVAWLHSFKKPSTRLANWTATWRIFQALPHLTLEEFTQDVFIQALDAEYAPETLQLTKAAWIRFAKFLCAANVQMPMYNPRAIRIEYKVREVRVITEADYETILKTLALQNKTSTAWAVRLSRWTSLRVGQVPKIKVGDLILSKAPYLIVCPFKGKGWRRISLSHLTEAELNELRTLKKSRLALAGYEGSLLVDDDGNALRPRDVSAAVVSVMKSQGIRSGLHRGKKVSFHGFRKYAIQEFLRTNSDVRYATMQAGHSMVKTTIHNYLHTVDLMASLALMSWKNPLNNPDLHIPIYVLAALLGVTKNGVKKNIAAYNQIEDPPIQLLPEDRLPDGPRPKRSGVLPNYLSVDDAMRLVGWMISRKEKQ